MRAAEYILGLLSPEESRRIEAEIGQDAELRAEVEAWRAKLAVLFDDAEVLPPGAVAHRLPDEISGEIDPGAIAHGAWMPDWLTAALVVKAAAVLSLILWGLLSL